MPNQTLVYLPFNRTVSFRATTNAYFTQRLTFTYENGKQEQWTGSGEGDKLMKEGQITTPNAGRYAQGFQIGVSVDSQQGNNWVPSAIAQSAQPCVVWYAQVILVVSEDYLDNDWNDTAVIFNWWDPPGVRVVPEGTGLAAA